MSRIWVGALMVCAVAVTAACDRDASGSATPASAASSPAASSPAAGTIPGAPAGSAAPSGTAAPGPDPIVTGTSKPPGGGGVAAAPPPCSELKPLIDRYLAAAKVTREAPGGVTTCMLIGEFLGATVDAQLRYGHSTAAKTVRDAASIGCTATARPLELPYKMALGCDNPSATVHSGVALAQGGSFAAAIITVTGESAGTTGSGGTTAVRAAVSDAAQKLAVSVLQQIG
jgi:hypothetical protein